ncbi:MAG: hypothetical protein ABR529_07640 [Actinomycetota bacterium]
MRLFPDMRRRLRSCAAVAVAAVAATAAPAGAAASLTTITGPCGGSSDPTLFPNNRRMVVTEGGRRIALFDPHGKGQQLVWRDEGEDEWRPDEDERGAGTSWFFADDEKNDRPASIALARDSNGRQHAWVVTSGYGFERLGAVKLLRVSNLDAPSGPTLGREKVVQAPGRGNARADLAFERVRGLTRGVLVWLQRTGDNSYDLVTRWFTNLDTDNPKLHHRSVLYTSGGPNTTATFVPSGKGMRVIARAGRLKVFRHGRRKPLKRWKRGTATVKMPGQSRPSAVKLRSGALLATFESNVVDHVVKVLRFSRKGNGVTTLLTTTTGYAQPSLASDGVTAWVVMVRYGVERAVVSRSRSPGSAWSDDNVEIGPSPDGDYAWPNTVRHVDGALRFVVDGQRCDTSTQANAVLAYERTL